LLSALIERLDFLECTERKLQVRDKPLDWIYFGQKYPKQSYQSLPKGLTSLGKADAFSRKRFLLQGNIGNETPLIRSRCRLVSQSLFENFSLEISNQFFWRENGLQEIRIPAQQKKLCEHY
jgi:hypothetical protein